MSIKDNIRNAKAGIKKIFKRRGIEAYWDTKTNIDLFRSYLPKEPPIYAVGDASQQQIQGMSNTSGAAQGMFGLSGLAGQALQVGGTRTAPWLWSKLRAVPPKPAYSQKDFLVSCSEKKLLSEIFKTQDGLDKHRIMPKGYCPGEEWCRALECAKEHGSCVFVQVSVGQPYIESTHVLDLENEVSHMETEIKDCKDCPNQPEVVEVVNALNEANGEPKGAEEEERDLIVSDGQNIFTKPAGSWSVARITGIKEAR